VSYLVSFSERPGRGRVGAKTFHVKWRSVTGQIEAFNDDANGLRVTIYYKRYSKLGRLLSANHESERHFIGRELTKVCTAWQLKPECNFSFVGV
jgi:hypothetical protein